MILRRVLCLILIIILTLGLAACTTPTEPILVPVNHEQPVPADQLLLQVESDLFLRRILRGNLFSSQIAVSANDVPHPNFSLTQTPMSGTVIDLLEREILFAHNLHGRLFPASTTKIITAYVALKHGNIDDIVTFDAQAFNLSWGAARGGFEIGDQVPLYDLLITLMLSSSNDATIAVAAHIAGSEAAFAELMNEEMRMLGATKSNFRNSTGLHDPNQWTTVYDLYLVFNAAIRDQRFLHLLEYSSHSITVERSTGPVELLFEPTSWYIDGRTEAPEGITVFGGKTGTTSQAGRCLVLLVYDPFKRPHIALIMGASSSEELYDSLNLMFESILQ